MSLNASTITTKPKKEFPVMDPGTYPARLVQVIDLGLQPQMAWEKEEKEPAFEIALTWEFPDEFLKDEDGQDMTDKPRWLPETLPLHNLKAEKAKSTNRYLALDPAQKFKGDFVKCLGEAANVTVIHNPGKGKNAGRIFNKVTGASPMREKDSAKLAALVNEPKYFDLDAPDLAVFMSLPNFIQEKIKSNLKFVGSKLEKMLEEMGGGMPEAPTPPTVSKKKVDNPF